MTQPASEKSQEIILVTGGSGFLGQHIVRELQLHDCRVSMIRVLDLRPYKNRLGYTESKPVCTFEADISQIEMCREAFRGVDCVIHAAAFVSYAYPADETKIQRVNIEGTRNVVQLCREEGVTRLVFISTAEVAMRPRFCASLYPLVVGQNEVRALTHPKGGNSRIPAYIFSKLEAERIALCADNTPLTPDKISGELRGYLRTVVLRPTPMYGELDPYWIPAALRAASWTCGHLVSPTYYGGYLGGRQQFTYAGNVAWATVLAKDALSDPTRVEMTAGVPIFITDDTVVDHYFMLVERIAGQQARAPSFWLPVMLTYPIAYLLEVAARVLHRTLPLQPTALISFLGSVCTFSRLRANIHLLYTPQYSEKEALERTAEYYFRRNSKEDKYNVEK